MNRTDFENLMIENGYYTEETTVNKNGHSKKCFIVKRPGSNIGLNIYDECIENATEDEMLYFVEDAYKDVEDIDTDEFLTKEKILENCYLVAIKGNLHPTSGPTWENDILGVKFFVKTRVPFAKEGEGSITINNEIMERYEIEESELFLKARHNTERDIEIQPLLDVIFGFGMLDEEEKDNIREHTEDCMYVLTNKTKLFGAGALAIPEIFENFCNEHNTDYIYVIPSSIHELILVTPTADASIEALSEMVSQVNSTEVKEEEVLQERAFIFDKTLGWK